MPAACSYCGTRLRRGRQSASGFSQDHLIPRYALRHSEVVLTMQQRNMNKIPCCIACNAKKGDMDPREWLAHINDHKRRAHIVQLLQLLPVSLVYGENNEQVSAR